MTCMQIRHAFSARLDGDDAGLDDAAIYAHLAGCTDCRGVVTVDSSSGAVTYNPEYYLLAHAGKYVVIKGREIIGIHDDFDAAVEAAW